MRCRWPAVRLAAVLLAVGLIVHADQAEQILRNGEADLIALAREFLHTPTGPWTRRKN